MRKLTLLLALLVSTTLLAEGFFTQPKYKLYSKTEGLNNNTVSAIYLDNSGYLWLGTDLGLTRSDGVHFRHYSLNDVGGSFITGILPLKDSLLWCFSNNYAAPVCFNSYYGETSPLEGLDLSYLKSLRDFCVVEGELYALNNSTLVHISVEYNPNSLHLSSEDLVLDWPVSRLFGSGQKLFLLSGDNLILFDPQSGEKSNIPVASLGINRGEDITDIKVFSNNLFAFGPSILPVCYNLESGKSVMLDTGDPIIGITQIDESQYIYATWNQIAILRLEDITLGNSNFGTFNLFDNMAPYAAIFRNRVNYIYYDAANEVLWTGISGRGLMKIAFRGERMNRIEIPSEVRSVNGIIQDRKGHIWISTNAQGVFRSTTSDLSGKMHFVPCKGVNKGKYVMFQDNYGNLWFGDSYGEVVKYNPTNDKVERLKIVGSKGVEIDEIKSINAVYVNSRNRLWVAAQNGLFVYDLNTNEVLAHMPPDERTGEITSIAQDAGGKMWIGTERGVCIAERDGSVINLTSGFEDKSNVLATRVLALYVNNYNQLYASYDDKTIHIDARSGEVIETMMLRKDYSTGHIACIADDGSGCTWLGTSSGVIMVNNHTLESYLYELPDSFLDVHILSGGELLWATTNGLVYFSPEDIKDWVGNRKLVISDLEINYNSVEDDNPHYFDEQLYFKRSENNLHVYVSDLRFGESSSKVMYRLLPLDEGWKSTYESCIELKDLKPGKYTLEVRSPHITEDEPAVTRMNFVIKPLWILSLWGVLTTLGAVFLILVLGYFYTIYRLRNKKNLSSIENRLLRDIQSAVEKEQRAKMRGHLRYEIIQKLRTPISLVIAPLKEISADSSISGDIKIKSNIALLNSVIVQEICTRLEDLFMLERDGIYKVAPYQVSVISNSTVSPLRELINTSKVRIYFDKDNKVDKTLWVDRMRISFLLRSLLVHTLQHVEYSNEVWLDIEEGVVDGKQMCIFIMKAKRIAGVKRDRVFSLCKDYEEAANQKLLGWELLQYIAKMHNADVIFKESVEHGLEISLYLPALEKRDWNGKTNVEIVEPVITENEQEVLSDIIIQESAVDLEVEESSQAQESNIKILVIEDNADIRLYMKVMFSKKYKMLFAESGEKGVEMALAELPNLILTDIMMPGMDGYEVLRIVKEDVRSCHIPVVLLTALTGEEDVIKGFDLGADDYITKPFNPEILRAKVRRLVKGRGELKQIYTKLLTSTGVALEENEEKIKQEDPLITKINALVVENIQNPDFNVKELASMLFMSQPTLYRKVKQLTGFTIIEVVRTARLKQAAELLKTKRYGVQEVSELVGYNDVPTFRKHFVALYGTTPSSFTGQSESEN